MTRKKILIMDYNIVYDILSGYSVLNQVLTDIKSDYVFLFNRNCQLQDLLIEKGYVTYIVPYGRQGGVNKIFDYGLLLFKAAKVILKEKPNIIHANNALSGRLAVVCSLLLNVPSVVQIRNVGLPRRTSFFLKRANRILAVSNYVKDSLPLSMQKVTDIVYDGHDFNCYKEKYSNEIVIAMASRLSKQKGIHLFIELEKRISLKYANLNIRFVHCGGVPSNESFLDVLSETSKIEWLGYINNISEFWQNADIAIIPSVGPEAFGRVVIEAISGAAVVIASRSGGPEEIITDGESGFLFNMEDIDKLESHVCFLIDSPEHRKIISKNGFDMISKKYSNQEYIKLIHKSYSKVFNG